MLSVELFTVKITLFTKRKQIDEPLLNKFLLIVAAETSPEAV